MGGCFADKALGVGRSFDLFEAIKCLVQTLNANFVNMPVDFVENLDLGRDKREGRRRSSQISCVDQEFGK
jgi:hypothetical protein